MAKAAEDPQSKPFRVVLKDEEDAGKAFVAGFNSIELAEKNAAERTEKGKGFKCKPEYEAIKTPA